jgi:DNA-binding transcriptional ArsR family regulator
MLPLLTPPAIYGITAGIGGAEIDEIILASPGAPRWRSRSAGPTRSVDGRRPPLAKDAAPIRRTSRPVNIETCQHRDLSLALRVASVILSLMEQYRDELSGVFQALADPTRRAVIARLNRGPASVGDLAAPFAMALPSFMKHIRFLEGSGLIRTRKAGRVRMCEIEKRQLLAAEGWLSEQRALWDSRADRLEDFVARLQKEGRPT